MVVRLTYNSDEITSLAVELGSRGVTNSVCVKIGAFWRPQRRASCKQEATRSLLLTADNRRAYSSRI